MIPQYVELEEDTLTLDLRYNISKTFPIMLTNYTHFRDYVFFLNKIINLVRSTTLLDNIKHCFFNNFLLAYMQPAILSNNLKVVRTNLQYLTFILKTSTNKNIVNGIFNFLFGLDDSKKEYFYKKKHYLDIEFERESVVTIKDKSKLKKKVSFIPSKTLSDKNIPLENQSKVNYEDGDDNRLILDDYDYKKHQNIDIALSILSNMKTQKEMINIVIYCLLEIFLEKCTLKFVDKLITPFIEVVLKKCPVFKSLYRI